jgi:hypothetical protein
MLHAIVELTILHHEREVVEEQVDRRIFILGCGREGSCESQSRRRRRRGRTNVLSDIEEADWSLYDGEVVREGTRVHRMQKGDGILSLDDVDHDLRRGEGGGRGDESRGREEPRPDRQRDGSQTSSKVAANDT